MINQGPQISNQLLTCIVVICYCTTNSWMRWLQYCSDISHHLQLGGAWIILMLAYVWTFGFTYPQYPNIINRLIKQHSNESESVFLTGYHDSITLTILAIQVFYFMFSYSLSIIALLRIFQYYQEYQNLYLYFLQIIILHINNIPVTMKEDLLILKLLKVPVIVIKYISTAISILTYLPNYLLILILDSIIFNHTLCSCLLYYVMSWPVRAISLCAVISIFCAQFYYLYLFLSISHYHWGIQLAISVAAYQGLLGLRRYGYLTMIKKFNPTKLKSPLEHLTQLWYILVDIGGILLTLFNTMLVINITKTFNYQYSPNCCRFIRHISKLIHKSIIDLIKLFYIAIFFNIFPWRYKSSINQVKSQQGNILQLTVLLTLLFMFTIIDLVFFIIFGLYCVVHPRRRVFIRNLKYNHEKYKVVLSFVWNSIIEILQIALLVFCLPFKYKYSINLLKLITQKQNDYYFHYVSQTLFVLKLTSIKIPSLLCEFILLISIYKYKKLLMLIKQKQTNIMEDKQNGDYFKIKIKQLQQQSQALPKPDYCSKASKKKQKKEQKNYEIRMQKQYLVFICFAGFIKQLPFVPLIIFSTIIKPWNTFWLKYLIDKNYDIRVQLVGNYFIKNIFDVLFIIPGLLSILTLGFYDPVKSKIILKNNIKRRNVIKQKLPNLEFVPMDQKFQFFSPQYSILSIVAQQNIKQIKRDILFLPLFVATRLSLLSLMGCQHPSDSVELVEYLWTLFYIFRVKRTGHLDYYLQLLKIDEAAGMIRNRTQKLRFWKFAHKSIRHQLLHRILSFLLPKRRAQKAIKNAQKQVKYSAISNHYWNQYNATNSLLTYFIYFVIECIVTLIGVVILFPLTLWRMPTLVILLKIHQYKKSMFFKILFKMYKMMVIDLITLLIKVFVIILFPRSTINFLLKNSFRYTKKGVYEFQKIQEVKFQFMLQNILFDGLKLYWLLFKIMFVKLFWIKKKDMNQQLTLNKIKLSKYVLAFLSTPQQIPNVKKLTQIYGGFQNSNQIGKQKQAKMGSQNNAQSIKVSKLNDINEKGLFIDGIVSKYVQQTKQCIPYLLLMIFLFFTLPWRVFYIKNALFVLRDGINGKHQFSKLVKTISVDYKCIFLYLVLLSSIVKTKRAIQLFYRNFKLNFYVGTLRYSHLKELKQQVLQAIDFYHSVVIICFSILFGPYRLNQIIQNIVGLYKTYMDQIRQQQINKKLYDNTIKQGKSLQLITTIGHNSLIQVFQFLSTKQLTRMTQVSKYMYESIKQRDDVWMIYWERVYAPKYQGFEIKNEFGNLSYNSMCVEKYKQQNIGTINIKKDRFKHLALNQLKRSVYQTNFEFKQQLLKRLPTQISSYIFSDLQWSIGEGYGPEQNWPKPDDNQQLLQLMAIVRRPIVQLDQYKTYESWLLARPVQLLMVRMIRFYDNNEHRKKKQLLYAITTYSFPFLILFFILSVWSWFWTIDKFIGIKFLFIVYCVILTAVFVERYRYSISNSVSLNPFDLKDDVKKFIKAVKKWVRDTSVSVGELIQQKFKRFVVRPIRWVYRRLKYYSNLFVEKVAKPLYISISDKIVALSILFKKIFKDLAYLVISLAKLLKKLVSNVYKALASIAKSLSTFYSNSLEFSLRLALSYGNIGQLVFTILGILIMVSPSIICYYLYSERWFIIFSTFLTFVLVVTGYKHLSRMKARVLNKN